MSACDVITALVPQTDARTVAQAYVDALLRGDCGTADLLATAQYAASPQIGCGAGRAISAQLDVAGAHPNADEAVYGVTMGVVDVLGLDSGEHLLFMQLFRQPDGTWRVNGIGSGP